MSALADIRRVPATLLASALLALAGCSGNVDPSPNVVDPERLTVLPSNAILYSGLPTTFVISGGTGSYIVASSNQAILPIAGNIQGKSFTLVPNPVLADTAVTLTVRDTGTTPLATALVTVKPGTVNNNITVTPSPTQDASCNPALCSGGDALVSVTVSQGGIPLAARGVDFTVVSGDFLFITTAPGVAPEQLAVTARTTTDQTGKATMRIRATALAPNQTALLQVTDVESGAYQRSSFVIAQFTGNTPAFFATPSSFTFTGPYIGQCASVGGADIVIYGGTPPYTAVSAFFALQLVSPSGTLGNPAIVPTNGGRLTVRITSAFCVTDSPITITDAAGRTITVTVTNQEGAGTAPPPALAVSPTSLTLLCGQSASFVAYAGSGTFAASTSHPRLTVGAAATGGVFTVSRVAPDPVSPPGPAAYPTAATVVVTDGVTTAAVGVNTSAFCP